MRVRLGERKTLSTVCCGYPCSLTMAMDVAASACQTSYRIPAERECVVVVQRARARVRVRASGGRNMIMGRVSAEVR